MRKVPQTHTHVFIWQQNVPAMILRFTFPFKDLQPGASHTLARRAAVVPGHPSRRAQVGPAGVARTGGCPGASRPKWLGLLARLARTTTVALLVHAHSLL